LCVHNYARVVLEKLTIVCVTIEMQRLILFLHTYAKVNVALNVRDMLAQSASRRHPGPVFSDNTRDDVGIVTPDYHGFAFAAG